MSIHLWWTFGSFPPFVYCQYCYKRGAQLSFWVPTFTLFRYISRNKISRLYGNSILNILRNCYTIFHSNCTILHSHQQLTGTPVSPYPYQHLLISELFKMCFSLNDTMDQLDLIDIYRTFHPKTINFTFFSSAHRTFSRMDHIMGHKPGLGKFKKIEIITVIFSDHSAVRLDINYRKKSC